MDLENDLFKKYKVDFNKLVKYGFKKENDYYLYSKNFYDNNFKTIIKIDNTGIPSGIVIDLDTNLEYTNIRVNNIGSFATKVKEFYKEILIDIRNNCYKENYFISNDANKICNYIIKKYQSNPEFLWDKYPNFGVFRNSNNKKWYALIANIDGKYFDISGFIDVINVKVDDKVSDLLKINGIYPAYHMNKKSWISIVLDGRVDINLIKKLIDNSFNLINKKRKVG